MGYPLISLFTPHSALCGCKSRRSDLPARAQHLNKVISLACTRSLSGSRTCPPIHTTWVGGAAPTRRRINYGHLVLPRLWQMASPRGHGETRGYRAGRGYVRQAVAKTLPARVSQNRAIGKQRVHLLPVLLQSPLAQASPLILSNPATPGRSHKSPWRGGARERKENDHERRNSQAITQSRSGR